MYLFGQHPEQAEEPGKAAPALLVGKQEAAARLIRLKVVAPCGPVVRRAPSAAVHPCALPSTPAQGAQQLRVQATEYLPTARS